MRTTYKYTVTLDGKIVEEGVIEGRKALSDFAEKRIGTRVLTHFSNRPSVSWYADYYGYELRAYSIVPA